MSGKEHTKNQHTVPKCYLKAWSHGEKGKEKIWALDTKTQKIEERDLNNVTVGIDVYETDMSHLSEEDLAIPVYSAEIEENFVKPIRDQINCFPKNSKVFLNKRFVLFLEVLEKWKNNPQAHKEVLDNAVEKKLLALSIEYHAAKVLQKIQDSGSDFPKLEYEEKLSLCLFMASQHLRTKSYKEEKEKYLRDKTGTAPKNIALLIAPQILSMSCYFLKCFQNGNYENILNKKRVTNDNPVFAIRHFDDEAFFRKNDECLSTFILSNQKKSKSDNISECLKISEKTYQYFFFFFPVTPELAIYLPAQKGALKDLPREALNREISKFFLEVTEIFGRDKVDLERMLSIFKKRKNSLLF